MSDTPFANIAIVACGTMSLELYYLKQEGFLDTSRLYYTTPGLHQDIPELARQLVSRIEKAGEKPEELLEYFDWMGIPIIPHKVTLDRFKSLLTTKAKTLNG